LNGSAATWLCVPYGDPCLEFIVFKLWYTDIW